MKRELLKHSLVGVMLALGISLLVAACGSSKNAADAATESSPAESGSIVVSGLVDYPMTFVTLDTDYMDWVTVSAEDPDAGPAEYDGVRLSEVFAYVGVQPEATVVTVTAYDGTSLELTLADIDQDALLTVTDDNAFELIMPGMGSEAWVGDVVMMEFN